MEKNFKVKAWPIGFDVPEKCPCCAGDQYAYYDYATTEDYCTGMWYVECIDCGNCSVSIDEITQPEVIEFIPWQ